MQLKELEQMKSRPIAKTFKEMLTKNFSKLPKDQQNEFIRMNTLDSRKSLKPLQDDKSKFELKLLKDLSLFTQEI